MNDKLYLQTDDRMKVGDKPMKHTTPESQKLHNEHIKNRNQQRD